MNVQLKELKCPTCGANLVPKSPDDRIIMCEYCGTVVYIEEEKKVVYVNGVSDKDRGETELALISLKAGNYKDAKRKFEDAISNNINNNVAWLGKAAADLHLGNFEESILAFQKTIELGSNTEMVISWGNYLISVAAYYQNLYYSYATSMDPIYITERDRYVEYSNKFNEYLLEIRKVIYEHLIEHVGEGKQVIEYALQLSYGLRDYGKMYELSEKLLAIEPNSKIGRYYRGISALYLRRYNEAVSNLYPLLGEMQNNYNVYIFLAYASARNGREDYACDILLSGYGRLRNPNILNALREIYNEWVHSDKKSAKKWRNSRKIELKNLGVESYL